MLFQQDHTIFQVSHVFQRSRNLPPNPCEAFFAQLLADLEHDGHDTGNPFGWPNVGQGGKWRTKRGDWKPHECGLELEFFLLFFGGNPIFFDQPDFHEIEIFPRFFVRGGHTDPAGAPPAVPSVEEEDVWSLDSRWGEPWWRGSHDSGQMS